MYHVDLCIDWCTLITQSKIESSVDERNFMYTAKKIESTNVCGFCSRCGRTAKIHSNKNSFMWIMHVDCAVYTIHIHCSPCVKTVFMYADNYICWFTLDFSFGYWRLPQPMYILVLKSWKRASCTLHLLAILCYSDGELFTFCFCLLKSKASQTISPSGNFKSVWNKNATNRE